LEPIFEADLQPEQYAYRANHSALQAVQKVHRLAAQGYQAVVDADLSGYFDSIPHAELMRCVARRVSDKALLHLLKQWLEAPVEETDERSQVRRTTRNKDEKRGTPQGAPISPLLANLYMRRFILGWKALGHETRLRARIVNYADDFVILCRSRAEDALAVMRKMMERLKLTVNETKTHVCRLPSEAFDFLGYTFGRMYSPRTGRAYLGARPARKKVLGICRQLSELTGKLPTCMRPAEVVSQVNRIWRGWANYFCYGTYSPMWRFVHTHIRQRLRQWLCRKFKTVGQGYRQYPNSYLESELGLLSLTQLARNHSWANT
jgi:group II intron reverse transcriptase/maturase